MAVVKKSYEYKLGTKRSGAVNTLGDLHASGMPLRQTLASEKSPAIGTGDKKRRPKGV